MKKILLIVLVTVCGIFIGCNRDEGQRALKNELRFSTDDLLVRKGYVLDYGLRNDLYYWQIILTDGEYDDYSGYISEETTYIFSVHLYSSTNDLTGDFEFANGPTSMDKFFTSSSMIIQNLANGTGPEVESGLISINGNSPTFSFDVDAMANGKRLLGNFEGTFKIEPGSFDQSRANDGTSDYVTDFSFGAVADWGPLQGGRTDGIVYTHYYRSIIISDVVFDITAECPTGSEMWLSLYSAGESGLLEGTYENGVTESYFYANGNTDNGIYWSANDGIVEIFHDGGDNYYVTWNILGDVYGSVREEGVPLGTINGEYKGVLTSSNIIYCD